MEKKGYKKESEESSSDKDEGSSDEEVSSSDEEATRRGFGTDDEELNYGNAGPFLSDLFEEERRGAVLDDVEEKELSLPYQTPMDVSDEVDRVCEERTMEVDDCEGKDLDDVPDDDQAYEEWEAVKRCVWGSGRGHKIRHVGVGGSRAIETIPSMSDLTSS